MEAKRERKQSTQEKAAAAAASAAVVSVVLGDVDLLGEIFLRLAFPSTLIRAAAVCKCWLRAASDPAFLRRFRDLHPPRLLGCYLSIGSLDRGWRVEFVPVPPQPTGVASVRRTSTSLGTHDSPPTRIADCRNGRVVIELDHGKQSTLGIHSPLHPARGMVILPPVPTTPYRHGTLRFFGNILSKEDGSGLSYFYFTLDYTEKEKKATACVYMLQAGAWHIHTSATTELSRLHGSLLQPPNAFIVDDKIYMGFTLHKIFVLDLSSSTFFTLKYPEGAVFDTNVVLSPADGSGFFLSHVNELQLCIWFHKGGKDNEGDWLLVDTICLREMCSNLRMSNSTFEAEYNARVVYIQEMGNNAEFVFLDIYGCLVYMDVRSRAWQKVYEVANKDTYVCYIHPFMTIWPPFFPMLQE
ncbi:unnamed protein product [Urochloa humidicola]